MTMRYMKHAPEAFLDQDAAAVAAHLSGESDQEAVARVAAARREIRKGVMQSARNSARTAAAGVTLAFPCVRRSP